MQHRALLSHKSLVFIFTLVVGSVLTLAACDSVESNPEPDDTTVQEDIANINAALDALIDDVSTWEQGPTSGRMADAFYSDEFGYDTRWIESVYYWYLLEDVESDIITRPPRRILRGIDFNASEGTYRLLRDDGSLTWKNTGSASGIELIGPATLDDAVSDPIVNNAVVTLSSYTDQRVTFNGDDRFLPTQASATIDISDQRVLELDLSNVEYDVDDDVSIPTSADLSLVTEPYEHTVQLRRNSDTEFDLQFSIEDEGDAVVDLGLLITLDSPDYTQIADEGSVDNVNFQLDFPNEISLAGDVQLNRLLTVSDPSEAQINQFVSANLLYRGVEVATLEYEEAREDFIIEYKDGTTDPASDYYDDFMERLEGILVELAGPGWYEPRG